MKNFTFVSLLHHENQLNRRETFKKKTALIFWNIFLSSELNEVLNCTDYKEKKHSDNENEIECDETGEEDIDENKGM